MRTYVETLHRHTHAHTYTHTHTHTHAHTHTYTHTQTSKHTHTHTQPPAERPRLQRKLETYRGEVAKTEKDLRKAAVAFTEQTRDELFDDMNMEVCA